MKKIKLVSALLSILMILPSCKSVYEDLPEPTYGAEQTSPVVIEEGDEYFTEGRATNYGNIQYGYLYYDYWIYEELQD